MDKLIFRIKKHSQFAIKVILILVVFSLMFFLDSVLAAEKSEVIKFEIKKENLNSNSPFLDSTPRIDDQAAEIKKTERSNGQQNYQILLEQNHHCFSLPQNMWVIMLTAYVFLLIFNLTYKLGEDQKLRWFWEVFYTLLALLTWYKFDECRKFSWFAQLVILIGVIIYSFYFYDRNRKLSLAADKKTEPEKTVPLPLK